VKLPNPSPYSTCHYLDRPAVAARLRWFIYIVRVNLYPLKRTYQVPVFVGHLFPDLLAYTLNLDI
jgi:hypothetical protein